MLPWMPFFGLWGSPLYNELYLGLCRALAGPWLGGVRSSRPRAEASPVKPAAAPGHWRVLDRHAAGRPTGAYSLAELRLAVRDGRLPHGGVGSGVASSGAGAGQNP